MELAELMTEFAEKFGVEGLSPDGEGVYRLDADGKSFAIADAEDGVHFVIWAEVGMVPHEGRERLYDTLLQAMHMGQQTSGAYFSIHEETIYLHQIESLADMSFERFKGFLEKFINTHETWLASIADFNSVLPEIAQEAQAQTMEFRTAEANGFIRA